jgi:hypothetical protein
MMDFMRDGGASMWLLLASAIATVVVAATRPAPRRPVVLLSGCILVLAEGLFGMAAGMKAVAANYARFPEPVAAIAEGLGELANNGVFAGALALLLGIAALVTRARLPRPAPVSALA